MSDKKIKIAICGLGTFAQKRLLPALAKTDMFNLIAVAGNSLENVQLNSTVKKYAKLTDLLNGIELDVVHVATPNSLHYMQALECLRQSTDVICEKPLATVSTHCDEMISLAKQHGRHLLVGHMLRASPVMIKVKSLLKSGAIGAVQSIKIDLQYYVDPLKRKWLWDRAVAGGGCVMDAGVHCIDAAQFLTDAGLELVNSNLKKNELGIETAAKIHLKEGQVKVEINLDSLKQYRSTLVVTGAKKTVFVDDFTSSWGLSKLKLINNSSGTVLQNCDIDVSSVYQDQYEKFASILLAKEIDYDLATNAAENIKLIEEIYAI